MKMFKYLSLFAILLILSGTIKLQAQESHSLYQNQSYRPYDRYVYNAEHRFHTSVKAYQISQLDSIVSMDSLYRIPVKKKVGEIFLNRSLIQFNKHNFHFTIDPLFNFEFGKDKTQDDYSWINTRGFMVNGAIGKKFSFFTAFYENQAEFNDYRDQIIKGNRVVPGQGLPKAYKETGLDYAYSEAYLSFTPNKYFNFQLGHGKHFIGDGYRSLLLSDHSFSYPYFKITTDIWNIKYVNLWMQFQDLTTAHPYGQAFDKKWGAFHYLDWSITPWLNIGLFEAIIWQNADSTGYRGFDVNYANPVIFFRPVEFSVGSPDNVLMGVNGKLTLFRKQIFYGQILIDEFKVSEIKNYSDGWWANKFAFQLGYKTYDVFKVKHLDIQTEFNWARPYTYSHLTPLKNYGHYNAPLAHPMGSNFLESLSFIRYNYKRLFFEARYSYAMHGSDTAGMNFGNDIFKSYNDRAQEYNNVMGQAEEVKLHYTNLSVSYMVNKRSNFNVYLSYTHRKTLSMGSANTQQLVNFGIRTSLSNFYYDY